MRVSILAILALILASLACGQYITPTPTVSPVPDATRATPQPTQQEATAVTVASASVTPEAVTVTALEALHVRQNASDKAIVIGYLYHADAVTLTGKCQTGWAQIEWNGGRAWVNARFLSRNNCRTN